MSYLCSSMSIVQHYLYIVNRVVHRCIISIMEKSLEQKRYEVFIDLNQYRAAWLGARAMGNGVVEMDVLDDLLEELTELDRTIAMPPPQGYDNEWES